MFAAVCLWIDVCWAYCISFNPLAWRTLANLVPCSMLWNRQSCGQCVLWISSLEVVASVSCGSAHLAIWCTLLSVSWFAFWTALRSSRGNGSGHKEHCRLSTPKAEGQCVSSFRICWFGNISIFISYLKDKVLSIDSWFTCFMHTYSSLSAPTLTVSLPCEARWILCPILAFRRMLESEIFRLDS